MTKAIAAFSGIALSCGVAQAQIALPQSKYDHPFDGALVVLERPSVDGIGQPCYPYSAIACARTAPGICYVFIRAGFRSPELIRHETGHCNGWPADHPIE